MSDETEQLKARVQELERELKRVQSKVLLSMVAGGAPPPSPSSSSANNVTGTVVGVEEMVAQVEPDGSLGYINGPMATLLCIKDRKKVLGQPFKKVIMEAAAADSDFQLDVLEAVVEAATAADQQSVIESVFPNLDPSLLPNLHSERPNSDPTLRIVATPIKGKVQVIVQDVTYMRWLEATFSRYVSPDVIQQMHSTSAAEFMRTEEREITILFADLRGFTAMCETLDPESVRDTVNSFLIGMVDSIEQYKGTVDKFVGDEVMALFGAPLHDPQHALNGLLCAVAMQKRHNQWIQERVSQNLPAPPMGVGLATGKVVIGNIGTPQRMDYTALGSNVNLAARLCSKAAGGEVLTTRATHKPAVSDAKQWAGPQPLPHLSFSKAGPMEFKNISEPVEVISVSSD